MLPRMCARNSHLVPMRWMSSPSPRFPLIEHYKSSWPEMTPRATITPQNLPVRTIPDSVLRFEMSAAYDQGSSLFYSHMKVNPADFKVILKV